ALVSTEARPESAQRQSAGDVAPWWRLPVVVTSGPPVLHRAHRAAPGLPEARVVVRHAGPVEVRPREAPVVERCAALVEVRPPEAQAVERCAGPVEVQQTAVEGA